MRPETQDLNFIKNPSDILNTDRWTDMMGIIIAFPAA